MFVSTWSLFIIGLFTLTSVHGWFSLGSRGKQIHDKVAYSLG